MLFRSCHSLLQGIFPTQGSNLGLLHCKQILYYLRHMYLYICMCIYVCGIPRWHSVKSLPARAGNTRDLSVIPVKFQFAAQTRVADVYIAERSELSCCCFSKPSYQVSPFWLGQHSGKPTGRGETNLRLMKLFASSHSVMSD